jgi:hypothetical protein
MIREESQRKEPNAMLKELEWAAVLDGLDRERMRGLVRDVEENEASLRCICEAMDRVFDKGLRLVKGPLRGYNALYEVDRADAKEAPRKKFYVDLVPKTWDRYKSTFIQMIRFVLRSETDLDDDGAPYVLSEE